MLFAGIVFALSLSGIAGLFVLKGFEEKRSTVLAPRLRAWGDDVALEARALFARSIVEADKLPPLVVRLVRLGIHELALGFAALARFLERQAHRLADLVSHKHHFERREPRSDFLRQVGEHKNNGFDTSH